MNLEQMSFTLLACQCDTDIRGVERGVFLYLYLCEGPFLSIGPYRVRAFLESEDILTGTNFSMGCLRVKTRF